MSNTKFINVTANLRGVGLDLKDGEERHVMHASDKLFVSVISTLIGPKQYEWETAICRISDPSDAKRVSTVGLDYVDVKVVDGDWREALEGKTNQKN